MAVPIHTGVADDNSRIAVSAPAASHQLVQKPTEVDPAELLEKLEREKKNFYMSQRCCLVAWNAITRAIRAFDDGDPVEARRFLVEHHERQGINPAFLAIEE